MVEEIKQFLMKNTNCSFIIEEGNDWLKVIEEINKIPNFDHYFELIYWAEQNKWEVVSVIRNIRRRLRIFDDKNVACFALVTIVIKYVSKPMIIKPNISMMELDQSNEKSINKIENLFTSIINDKNYSIFSQKTDAVVLLKQNSVYSVSYYDNQGNEYIISEDNEDFELSVNVLFNHAWYLYLLDQLIENWPYEIKNLNELEKIKKMMLRIK
ncbi:hypothetical protein [Alkalihalophilus marmarensis]|uniref:hypothetical protein n=1 Tax=Alkalihalophilus marmarensis TaxID=521377 RepID=UPI002DB73502|nr:hypothetical protein [Alkalihalophilus marmarensis]MEC2072512.1 hypothetical protein [Alkalihalophilus marmarensis]